MSSRAEINRKYYHKNRELLLAKRKASTLAKKWSAMFEELALTFNLEGGARDLEEIFKKKFQHEYEMRENEEYRHKQERLAQEVRDGDEGLDLGRIHFGNKMSVRGHGGIIIFITGIGLNGEVMYE